jgi:glycine C-acetyltransferase
MYGDIRARLQQDLDAIRQAGLYKEERVLGSPQGAVIRLQDGREVLNFCTNNYLGLASHPQVIAGAHAALERWGYGMSSVRFICGTQAIHRELEARLATFLGRDDAILYAACFDANGGVFEPFLGEDGAIITDALNHASIIDGIRLSKAQRAIYRHSDMEDLEAKLRDAAAARIRMIVTDGVFSMDGDIANLGVICALAERYDALVLVDDSHATGVLGPGGRGTAEHCGVEGRVDLFTGTLGKALGGGLGGFVAAPREMVEYLRQRSRPYLFSNTIPPVVAGAALAALDLIAAGSALRERLWDLTRRFRSGIAAAGFEIRGGEHPIVPIMLYDAALAQGMARDLLAEGIYVIGFSFPVVPKDQARIRVQISAAHEPAHIDRAIEAFGRVGRRHGALS